MNRKGYLSGLRKGKEGRGLHDGVRIPSVGNVEPPKEHHVVLTVIFKEELAYLEEWIEYHRLLGVDHFYFYNNECDNRSYTGPILAPYVEAGWITHIDWCVSQLPQVQAYNHALKTYGDSTHWMGFTDVDEFLVPLRTSVEELPYRTVLRTVLEEFEPFGGVFINWYLFGSNGHQTPPAGSTLTQFLTRAAPHEKRHGYGKTIMHPGMGRFTTSVHKPFYSDPHFGVATDKQPIPNVWSKDWQKIDAVHERLALNHYRPRSVQEYLRKLARGRPHTPTEYNRVYLRCDDILDMRIIEKAYAMLDMLAIEDAEEAGRVEAIILDWGRDKGLP